MSKLRNGLTHSIAWSNSSLCATEMGQKDYLNVFSEKFSVQTKNICTGLREKRMCQVLQALVS